MAEIRPQPQSPALGALARMLGAARDAAGRVRIDSQLLGQTSLADLLSLPGAASLAEDVSYFGPAAMLKPGSGRTLQTFKIDPRVLDAADVALNVSPLGALAAKGAARAARPVARAAGEAVNRAMLTGEGPLATALAPVAPRQLIVYHGTPHRFEPEEGAPMGRFRSEKIGTGEGAQAYGHGLYFAESPGVAKSYAEYLGGNAVTEIPALLARLEMKAVSGTKLNDDDVFFAIKGLPGLEELQNSSEFKKLALKATQGDNEALAGMQNLAEQFGKKGSLYTVDLPDEAIARMLDWDKPLSEQPKAVREAIEGIIDSEELYKGRFAPRLLDRRVTGGEVLEVFQNAIGGPDVASNYLRDAGIPGIRYLDQGSRGSTGTGRWNLTFKDGTSKIYDFKPDDDVLEMMGATATPHGTSNFVVFPGAEDMLTILERKAKGGPVRRYAEGGAVHAAQYDPADIARRAASLMEEIDAA